jgi:hypothetical protein
MTRQSYTIDELKRMLAERVEDVAARYAPAAPGSYVDKGVYYTLNPGRADRRVGSFVINFGGPRRGHWHDFATAEHGDMLDLIQLALGCDIRDALREARQFLGLQSQSPEDVARRKAQLEAAKARRAEAERQAREDAAAIAKRAHGLWLAAEVPSPHGPVARYLRDTRGIELDRLPRWPQAIRYMPQCFWTETDPETGEVLEAKLPAMVAAVNLGKRIVALHRTYLEMRSDGSWGKAPVAKAKKVMGEYRGGAIRVWAGLGPKGGHPVALNKAGPDQHVFLTEGIEDALTAAMLLPEARILAAISLSNLAAVELPRNVSRVTLIADRDEGAQAQEALQRAIEAHARAGREVRLWQPPEGSGAKDLNDVWQQRRAGERANKGAA